MNSQKKISSLIIVIKSSWLISLFIYASDILLPMLFNLFLANITISLCFFSYFLLFLIVFFTIPVEIENERLKFAFAIPTGASTIVSNDAIEMLPVVTDKTINDLSK